ncbi:alpha/beta hydrolase [Marinobacter sp. JSM 1782161]|uniref:alpha/beta hydrolase n=1 Tax=Marinobacter sp. JSM 1782161 TaxID=2685906 RepID=UPI001403B58C|nr:alpha/beta hydrolase [Marinobacter sp. JSM 1782161]
MPPETGLVIYTETRVNGQIAIRSWLRFESIECPCEASIWVDIHSLEKPDELPERHFCEATLDSQGEVSGIDFYSSSGTTHFRFGNGQFRVNLPGGVGRRGDFCAEVISVGSVVPVFAWTLSKVGFQDGVCDMTLFNCDRLVEQAYRVERQADASYKDTFGQTLIFDDAGCLVGISKQDVVTRLQWSTALSVPAWGKRQVLEARADSPDQSHYACEPVVFDTHAAHIAGDVLLPTGGWDSVKAVSLFIGGTGAYDRYGICGSMDLGYHEMHQRLADAGVAVLRIDLPGNGESRYVQDKVEPDFREQLAFYEGALESMDGRLASTGPVHVIGHSMGGVMALELAARCRIVASVILINAPGRPVDALMRDQAVRKLDALGVSETQRREELEKQDAFFYHVQHTKDWSEATVPADVLPLKSESLWFRQLMAVDPGALLSRLEKPALVIVGQQDEQVFDEDARLLAAALGRPERFVRIRDLAHHFKAIRSRSVTETDKACLDEVTGAVLTFMDSLNGLQREDGSFQ